MSAEVTIRIPPRRGERRRGPAVCAPVAAGAPIRPRPRPPNGSPGWPACWPSPTTGGALSSPASSATRPTSRGSSACRGRA